MLHVCCVPPRPSPALLAESSSTRHPWLRLPPPLTSPHRSPPPSKSPRPCLPAAEPRTQESYYSSVSVSQLVGAAYQAAEQAWLPVRRKLREGSVVHVYLPDASLRLQGGLWVSALGARGVACA